MRNDEIFVKNEEYPRVSEKSSDYVDKFRSFQKFCDKSLVSVKIIQAIQDEIEAFSRKNPIESLKKCSRQQNFGRSLSKERLLRLSCWSVGSILQ
jgi:hypothetical protein